MIYKDLENAKEDLKWLLGDSSIISDSTNSLGIKKVEMILESFGQKNSFDMEYLKSFYGELFASMDFLELKFSSDISKQFLPSFAIVPKLGILFVLEKQKEGYKVFTKEGVGFFDSFPSGTLFAKITKKASVKNSDTSYTMFKSVALEQKRLLVYAAAATFSINTLALGTSLYTMQVYDRVVPTGAISTLIALSIGVFIAIFLEMVIKFSRSTLSDYATKKMDMEYSNDVFSRFLKVRCDALPKSIGTLTGQLQSYSSVRAFITSAAMFVFIDLPFSLIFIGAIFLIGGFAMGLVPIVFLILSLIVGLIFRKKIEEASKNSSMASHKKMGLMVETVENSENIKATGAGFNILNNWNNLTVEAIDDDIEMKHYSDMSSYITAFLQQLSYVTIVSLGAYLVAEKGDLTMGALIAMTILSGRILQPIAAMPNHFVQWGKAKLAVKDLDSIYKLSEDNEGVDRPLSPYLDSTNLRCKDVSFGYSENSTVVNVAELNIKEGEKVAILGAIGSGKSTLLKILAGLYKPTKGFVYLDGIDMQLIKRDFLTENMSYLPQTTKLFAGTLRDNLIFGMIGVGDEKIIEAAKLTGLIALINALPNGLDSVVPEGGESVSGGQKQLIALTRMLIANKKIILLDEPTASMDEGTERNIIAMLQKQLASNQTMVVVTHKPIVLNMVDRIIVLTPAGVAIDGTKEEVLSRLAPKKQ